MRFYQRQEVLYGPFVAYVLSEYQRLNGEWWVTAETKTGTQINGKIDAFRPSIPYSSILEIFHGQGSER